MSIAAPAVSFKVENNICDLDIESIVKSKEFYPEKILIRQK